MDDSAREFRECLDSLKWWERAVYWFCASVVGVAGWIALRLGWYAEDDE